MAYEEVTSPIILDSTGQQIHSDLQQIKNVLTTPSAAADITFDNTGTGMQADDVQDAITELKSNLTDLATPSPLGQDLSSHLNAGWSVSEYIRYSKIGAIVIVDIGGLSKASTGPEAVINNNNNYLPNAITRPLGVVTNDSSNDTCLLFGSIGDTGITIAAHRSGVRYFGEIIYLTDE